MTRYRVAFDGKWQGAFKEREDALGWAEDVGETGRLVYVIQRRWWRWPRLVATFPESEAETARVYWKVRGGGGDMGGAA